MERGGKERLKLHKQRNTHKKYELKSKQGDSLPTMSLPSFYLTFILFCMFVIFIVFYCGFRVTLLLFVVRWYLHRRILGVFCVYFLLHERGKQKS